MFDIAFKNLWGRKTRSILCILAVMVSVYLNGTTTSMSNWMYEVMTGELARYMGKIYVQQSGSSYPPIDSSISQETAEIILARSDLELNMAESAPLLFIRTERAMMPFMPANKMVIGVPIGREEALLGNIAVIDGVNRFGTSGESQVAILGERAAKSSGATVGQDITINGQTVRVIGILQKSSVESLNIAVVMPLETVQQFFALESTVSVLLLTPQDVNKTLEIAAILRQDYPLLDVVTQDDMLTNAQEVLRFPLMYMRSMSLTGFIVAIAVVMSTMVMAVMERTREIGTLRAIGARKRLVIGLVFVEVFLLSLAGGIPGALLTIPMAIVMDTTIPSPTLIAQIVLVAVVAGVVSSLYPAWRAAHIDPIEALRYE